MRSTIGAEDGDGGTGGRSTTDDTTIGYGGGTSDGPACPLCEAPPREASSWHV